MMKKLKGLLAPFIEEYTAFRQALGYSSSHQKYLWYLDDFAFNYYPNERQLTERLVKEWLKFESGCRPSFIRDEIFAVRGFAKYLGDAAYLLPTNYIPRKKSPAIPYMLSMEELRDFFTELDKMYWRDPLMQSTISVMLRLIYTCGLRPMECKMLLCSNVNLTSGELLITKTKRHIERTVQMSNDMHHMMQAYDAKRKIFQSNSRLFFVRGDGQAIKGHMLRRAVDMSWKVANVGSAHNDLPDISPYTFRHQFASSVLMNWLDEGKDLYAMLPYLKAFMGHSHFSSTSYYIHILPQRLASSAGVNWDALDLVDREVSIWDD